MPYLKGMHDKVIHVVIMHHVVAELLGQHLLDADLLCADEALDHHTAQQAKVKLVYGTKFMSAQSSLLTCSVCFDVSHQTGQITAGQFVEPANTTLVFKRYSARV